MLLDLIVSESIEYIPLHVNLHFKGKQGNEPESTLYYFHPGKKAAEVGFEHVTCLQGSHCTN